MTDRLAMSAVLAGLPAWSPETHDDVMALKQLRDVINNEIMRQSNNERRTEVATND